ncbi:MAG: DUF3783 domain-containing protein, partial [Coriobacteriia bacterium]|nr:DUF3783 domain-containing protein [Coriobacteriia bacterium]
MAQKKSKKGTKAKRPEYCVALLNLDHGTERGDVVRGICKELGIPVRTIVAERLGDPVGAVVGLVGFRPAFVPYAGPVPECEFMLLSGLPNALMDSLLLAMRDADVSVGCKAAVTKFNKKWAVIDLVSEVAEEHANLQAYLAAQAAGADGAAGAGAGAG